jgi:hypothetical protein
LIVAVIAPKLSAAVENLSVRLPTKKQNGTAVPRRVQSDGDAKPVPRLMVLAAVSTSAGASGPMLDPIAFKALGS